MQQRTRSRPLRIGVCADDFGMSPRINHAIVALAGAQRISALSCLVDGPAAEEGAARLHYESPDVDIGLHLNLTEALPGAPLHLPLPLLVARCYARLMDAGAVRAEVRRQLDRFEHLFDCVPDHVDGHRHVHQLPVVRTALLDELGRRYPGRLPWVRSGRPARMPRAVKPAIIGALGAGTFTQHARRRGFETNNRLLGVYDFQGSGSDYLQLLAEWFAHAGDDDLLMCHPGAGGDEPHGMDRRGEYLALASPQFALLLARANLVVTRLSPLRWG